MSVHVSAGIECSLRGNKASGAQYHPIDTYSVSYTWLKSASFGDVCVVMFLVYVGEGAKWAVFEGLVFMAG